MDIQYSEEEFKKCKSVGKLPLLCLRCGRTFLKRKSLIVQLMQGKAYYSPNQGSYCSISCHNGLAKNEVDCLNCSAKFLKYPKDIKRSKGKNFCSSSCSASFNNRHKTTGTRRSKLEVWIEEQLRGLYPDMEILFNRKDSIGSELDVYFPSLKVAFELNGIFHYEPVFGESKLNQIEGNDHRKFQACGEAGISLCVIDTSQQKKFTEKSSEKYLSIIKTIVDDHL